MPITISAKQAREARLAQSHPEGPEGESPPRPDQAGPGACALNCYLGIGLGVQPRMGYSNKVPDGPRLPSQDATLRTTGLRTLAT